MESDAVAVVRVSGCECVSVSAVGWLCESAVANHLAMAVYGTSSCQFDVAVIRSNRMLRLRQCFVL